jgi:two-component system sensor histidine kinase HydH
VWRPEARASKITILAAVTAVTLGIHYEWLVEPFFGHVHWVHAIHGRLCYIPIVISAAWFGLRGGLVAAATISLLLTPYIVGTALDSHQLADELTEIVFYFAIAVLTGALIDRELRARKRAEDARLQLERSQKLSLVGQIAAGMAHEIKNPLASIKGAVEILGDESTSASEEHEFRQIVIKEIKRIDRSLTDFLEFARPAKTEPRRFNLSDAVRDAVRQMNAQAKKRGVTINEDIESAVHINGDREKIHQVLLNLMINAMEASSPESSIGVGLEADPPAGRAVLTVRDTGAGLSALEAQRAFEPFFSSKPSGTGLGLAVAKSIVDRHGGRISVTPGDDGGALATVILPLSERESKQ